MAYTKLFQSIITSTIWMEDDATRIVWITMLALADKNGEVAGSIPGLARVAGVSVEDCRKAISAFKSPDPDSRSKVEDGRRVEDIDGGWSIINHAKYRAMASREDEKSKAAIRQKRYREKKKRDDSLRCGDGAVTQDVHIAEADTYSDTDKRKPTVSTPPTPPRGGSVQKPKTDPDFEQFYKAYPKKKAKVDALKAWKQVKKKLPPIADIVAAVEAQKKTEDWRKDGGQFIPLPATWLRGGRWDDEIQQTKTAPEKHYFN